MSEELKEILEKYKVWVLKDYWELSDTHFNQDDAIEAIYKAGYYQIPENLPVLTD